MKIRQFSGLITSSLLFFIPLLVVFLFASFSPVYAATSPTLGESSSYSVLGGSAITNTGTTTVDNRAGVSPGTSITGTATLTAGGGLHANDASAIAAQADTLSVFGALDQTCDFTYGAQDLTLISPLAPGVYCSTSSFSLSGNLTLSGSGVWIFKTVSTLITSPGSSVTGSDPCNVWWRIGSAATLGTTTSFIGNIVTANVADTTALNTGATLNGRILAQAGATVTLDANTISGPTCATTATTTTNASSTALAPIDTTSAPNPPCPTIAVGVVAPNIIDARRVDVNSIFLSWGPYSGTDRFIVRYGPSDGNWLYNTDVTGFSTTLNSLPSNTPIWVQVAARNDCQIGEYGATHLIGGSSVSLPNAGAPRLPNTGLSQEHNHSDWFILAGILLGSFILLISFPRKV